MTETPSLGGVRISRLTDDTTSPVRQRADLERQPGAAYVYIAEDLDVSASKHSPFARPDIGPWLTEPEKIAQYDQVVIWKLDRFCRSAKDMRDMLSWADEHGKRLIFQKDNLIYDPNASGIGKAINDAIITLVAAFAEIEALNISVRVKSLHAFLRENKSWGGGPLPLGYELRKEGDRKILVKSRKSYPVFEEIEDRLLAGESKNSIAQDFNARGVLTPADWSRVLQGKEPRGARWTPNGVRIIFESDTSLGYLIEWQTIGGKRQRVPVRDDDGNPVQAWEPITTKERLRRVREALAHHSTARRPHVEREINPLLGIAKCYECGGNLARRSTRGDTVYLTCSAAAGITGKRACSSTGHVPLDTAWGYLENFFLYHEGHKPVVEGRYVKASPDAARLEELKDEWSAISEQAARARSQTARERLQRRLDELDASMAELETASVSSGRWETTEQGETYAERWRREDDDGRRAMMLRAGYALRIKRTPRTNHYEVEVTRKEE